MVCCNTILICIISAERNILRCIIARQTVIQKKTPAVNFEPYRCQNERKDAVFLLSTVILYYLRIAFLARLISWAIKSSLEPEYSCLFSSFICLAAEHVGLWNFLVFTFNTYSVFAVSAETSVLSPDKELTPVA